MSAQKHWLPRLEQSHKGCLNCGPLHAALPENSSICVGFGAAGVTRDGKGVWQDDINSEEEPKQAKDFTLRARNEPEHDWRIYKEAPLYGAVYQWQNDAWYLVERSQGFA